MANYRDRIQEVKGELARRQEARDELLRRLGEYLRDNPPSGLDAQLQEDLETVERTTHEIQRLRDCIERVGTITARFVEIDEELKQQQEALRETEHGYEELLETIGEAAFNHYRANPGSDRAYAEIFEPLVEARESIEETRREITGMEQELEARPFLDKMVQRGKLALLRSRLSARETSLPKLYRAAGKQFLEGGYQEHIDSDEIRQALEPHHAQQSRARQIKDRMEELRSERQSLETELEELGASRRPNRRVNEYEQEITKHMQKQRQALIELGAEYRRQKPDPEQLGQPVRDLIPELDSAEKSVKDAEKLLNRLQAGHEVQRLDSELEQLNRTIKVKQDNIARLEQEIAQLEQRKQDAEQERKKQAKKRGSEDDLVSLE